jgi:nucleotide-binding universal stress UspA family protein
VASVRRIVVGVNGSLGSLQALRYAADEARGREVPMVVVIAWTPPGGDMSERGTPEPQMRVIWRDAAVARLRSAFDEGLGGVPADLQVEQAVWRGEAGPVLADIAREPGDLLVIGPGGRSLPARVLRKSVGRYLLTHARCPVVAVPPSALMEEMGRGFWPLRRHALLPDIPQLPGE